VSWRLKTLLRRTFSSAPAMMTAKHLSHFDSRFNGLPMLGRYTCRDTSGWVSLRLTKGMMPS